MYSGLTGYLIIYLCPIYEETFSDVLHITDVCVPLQDISFFASEFYANNALSFGKQSLFKTRKKMCLPFKYRR